VAFGSSLILTTSATRDAEALHITRPVGEPTMKNTMIRLAIERDRDVDSFFAAARKNNFSCSVTICKSAVK